MAQKKSEANNALQRDLASCYGDGHWPIPVAGEDRNESVYRNPVGAQSGYTLEGQRTGPCEAERAGSESPRRGTTAIRAAIKAAIKRKTHAWVEEPKGR